MNKVRISSRDNNIDIKRQSLEIHNIAQLLKVMMEAEGITQSLQIQDEEDRHSIALWGLNNTKKMKNTISSLKISNDETPPNKTISSFPTAQNFLYSTNEFRHPSTNRHKDGKNNFIDIRLSPKQISPKRHQMLSQRSTNFAPKSNSMNKSALNPFHYKRSLPEIMQSKNVTKAA